MMRSVASRQIWVVFVLWRYNDLSYKRQLTAERKLMNSANRSYCRLRISGEQRTLHAALHVQVIVRINLARFASSLKGCPSFAPKIPETTEGADSFVSLCYAVCESTLCFGTQKIIKAHSCYSLFQGCQFFSAWSSLEGVRRDLFAENLRILECSKPLWLHEVWGPTYTDVRGVARIRINRSSAAQVSNVSHSESLQHRRKMKRIEKDEMYYENLCILKLIEMW